MEIIDTLNWSELKLFILFLIVLYSIYFAVVVFMLANQSHRIKNLKNRVKSLEEKSGS
jgi:hypothetical protein